jgi:WD40 repeat protein
MNAGTTNNVGKLLLKQAFGLNPQSRNSVAFTDEHTLAYACGHQVVILNMDTKEQSFIPCTQHPYISLGISSIACSTTKKLIAVGEICEPTGAVALYDSLTFRRKKILQTSDLGSNYIVSVAFSSDGRFCVMQGGAPEWNLVLWNIERAVKLVSITRASMSDEFPIHQVSFCPWDSNVIVATGKGYAKMFRVSEGQLKPATLNVRRDTSTNFTAHAWVFDDKLLLGTEAGEIILLESFDFRAVVYPVAGEQCELVPIYSLLPISKGFMAGTSFGDMWIFENSEDYKEQFQKEDVISVPGHKGNVVFLGGLVEEALVCATDSNQLYSINLNTAAASKENGAQGVDYLITSFHHPNDTGDASIVDIDVAQWRPVVLTCGRDKVLRLWNIQDNKMELVKDFGLEMFSVAIHPSGMYAAVGFAEKIKLFAILLDDLCVSREFHIRNSSCVKFSRGGHLLACGNGTNVQIYNVYSGQLMCTLRGHSAKVRAIIWLDLDFSIQTIAQDGSIFVWNVPSGTQRGDRHIGALPITTGTSFGDNTRAYTISPEMVIKEVMMKKIVDQTTGVEMPMKAPKDVQIDRRVSCGVLQQSKKLLLLGTCDADKPGAVLSMVVSPSLASQYEAFPFHAAPITAMCMSYDGDLLYTADANGCLCISDIEGAYTGKLQQQAKAKLEGGVAGNVTIATDFIADVFIRKTELDERRARVNELMSQVEELNLNNEHLLRLKEIEHKERIKDITTRFSNQLNTEKMTFDSFLSQKNTMEIDHSEQLDHIQMKHEHELTALEDKYKAKLNAEAVRHRQVSVETEEVYQRWNEENRELVETHQATIQKLTADYDALLAEQRDAQQRLRLLKEQLQINHILNRDLTESDIDAEVLEMKTKYDARIKFEEETSVGLMAEHTIIKRNLQMLNKDTEVQSEEIKKLKEKQEKLTENIRSLEKDIQSHKKEIREREETITDKEKRIFDLKKKNQELEKFRFVLDYKIKELKLQIAPREAEITTMRKQIEEMDIELEQYHKSNSALQLMITELKLKIDGLRTESGSQDTRIFGSNTVIDKFLKDLKEAWAERHDHALLKQRVVSMFRIYVQEEFQGSRVDSGANKVVLDAQTQYNRDREQMERSIDALKRSLHTDTALQRRDMTKIMKENVVLTKQLNELKKEEKTIQKKWDAVQYVQANATKTNIGAMMAEFDLGGDAKKPPSGSNSSSTGGPRPPVAEPGSNALRRSMALRSSSAGATGGKARSQGSRSDLREAWRELEMQESQMRGLEDQLGALCSMLNIDFNREMRFIDGHGI